MNALSGILIGSPSLGKALAASVAFHAGMLALMAGWTFSWVMDRAELAGTYAVVSVELTLAEEPEEMPAVEMAVLSEPVLIAPDYVEMPDQQRFEDVSTARVMEVDLTDEMLDDLPDEMPAKQPRPAIKQPRPAVKQPRPAAASPPPRKRPQPQSAPTASNSSVRTPPKFTNNRPPRYPDVAHQRGWEGTVMLRLKIAEDGRVTDVEVVRSSGYAVLDAAAVRAVRTWRGEPARRGGKPVATVELLPVRFQLP